MPYITKNTFYKIIGEIDLNREPPPKKSRLEGKNLTLLSKKELQRLAAITEILGSKDIPTDRFFLKLKKPIDTFSYVNPERTPSYHEDKNYIALTREYENYRIPEDIRIKGAIEAEKFRKFFFENKPLFTSNKTEFLYKTKREFNLNRLPEDVTEVRAANSGHGKIDDFNLSSIEDDLDTLILYAENFKNKDNNHRYTINLYGHKIHPEREASGKEQIEILLKWIDLKKDIKKKYIIYSMAKNNPEINLSGNFLNALGLNNCALCTNNNNNNLIDI